MKLVAYRNVHDCDIQFQDEYWYIFEHAVYNNFKQGKIKNPYDKTVYGAGMLGSGKYMTKYPGETHLSKIYVCWSTILARCYLYSSKYPAYYKITTICDEWLDFQVFAKWYEENDYELPSNERLEIDKDILFPCNKLYSPKTCMLVPQKINLIFTNMNRNDGLPNGIRFSHNGKRYLSMYNTKHLGTFDTLEEAFDIYAKTKEEAIKMKADEYREHIPQKLYDALYNYKVKIENDKNYEGEMDNDI